LSLLRRFGTILSSSFAATYKISTEKSCVFAEKPAFPAIKMQLSQTIFHFLLLFKFISHCTAGISISSSSPKKIVPKTLP
jgi:hypothetical protein